MTAVHQCSGFDTRAQIVTPGDGFKVGIDHFADELREGIFGLPAEHIAGFGRISDKHINFRRTVKPFVHLTYSW